MYGYDLHGQVGNITGSKGDNLLVAGQQAGETGDYLDSKHDREVTGTGFHHSVSEKPFNLITGGHSSIVGDLVAENREDFGGSAGVTSSILDNRKVEDPNSNPNPNPNSNPNPNPSLTHP